MATTLPLLHPLLLRPFQSPFPTRLLHTIPKQINKLPKVQTHHCTNFRMASTKITPYFTDKGVPPLGPYSPAIKAGGFIFISGQIPANTARELISGTVAEKTHKMCQNAAAVLEAAGSGLEKTVKVTIYFTNLEDFEESNEVYATYFPHRPARSAVEVSKIPLGASLEMDLIALE